MFQEASGWQQAEATAQPTPDAQDQFWNMQEPPKVPSSKLGSSAIVGGDKENQPMGNQKREAQSQQEAGADPEPSRHHV